MKHYGDLAYRRVDQRKMLDETQFVGRLRLSGRRSAKRKSRGHRGAFPCCSALRRPTRIDRMRRRSRLVLAQKACMKMLRAPARRRARSAAVSVRKWPVSSEVGGWPSSACPRMTEQFCATKTTRTSASVASRSALPIVDTSAGISHVR